jgi:hypothetical protein
LTADPVRLKVSTIAKLNSQGAAAMSDDLNTLIGYDVQRTAEWRWRKAEEFPDDDRNERAAEELGHLAKQIEALEGSPLHQQIRTAQDRLLETCEGDGDVAQDLSTTISVQLRSIGFHIHYETAEDFLHWYLNYLREKLREEINDPPQLREHVENDPAVKAAKEIYDAAYDRAYAEARKNLRRETLHIVKSKSRET